MGIFTSWYKFLSLGDGASGLPDQVFGVYFGWAKDESSKILKILMSVKWDGGCCSLEKLIVSNYLLDFYPYLLLKLLRN